MGDVGTENGLQASGSSSQLICSADVNTYQSNKFLSAKIVQVRFLSVVFQVKQMLKHCDPKRLLIACGKLNASANHLESIPLFDSSYLEDLANASTAEILSKLSVFWNWNSHCILRSLLEESNCQAALELLDKFDAQIDTNQPMELYPIPSFSMNMIPYSSSAYAILTIRGEHYQNGLAPLQYISDVATVMVEKFEISRHAFQLTAVHDHPLTLYWMIPKSVLPLISKGVFKHLIFMKENGFLEIKIYPDIVLYAINSSNHGSSFMLSNCSSVSVLGYHIGILKLLETTILLYSWPNVE